MGADCGEFHTSRTTCDKESRLSRAPVTEAGRELVLARWQEDDGITKTGSTLGPEIKLSSSSASKRSAKQSSISLSLSLGVFILTVVFFLCTSEQLGWLVSSYWDGIQVEWNHWKPEAAHSGLKDFHICDRSSGKSAFFITRSSRRVKFPTIGSHRRFRWLKPHTSSGCKRWVVWEGSLRRCTPFSWAILHTW